MIYIYEDNTSTPLISVIISQTDGLLNYLNRPPTNHRQWLWNEEVADQKRRSETDNDGNNRQNYRNHSILPYLFKIVVLLRY